MIIIEGPDGGSKSTLVNFIQKHSELPVIKPFYPKVNQLRYYLTSPAQYANSYLERYYISELVYPRFKANRDPLPIHAQYMIEAGLLPFSPIIIYCRPEEQVILNNIKTRGDDYISPEEVNKMITTYDNIISNSYIANIPYDYNKDNQKILMEQVEYFYFSRLKKASLLKKYMSSGNYFEEGVPMFIGDIQSDSNIGRGILRASLGEYDENEYLHEALLDSGFYEDYEMPYFTNWNKWEGNDTLNKKSLEEEIEIVKPNVIICLGEKVRKKAGIGETIADPLSIKKEYNREIYTQYIESIKKKINEH